MVLWAIFGVELAGLVALGAHRRWLLRAAQPTLTRAMERGEQRQDRDERLPLTEMESRQRLQNVALTASAGLGLPGAIAVLDSELASEWCIPALFLTGMIATDVAVVLAVIVAMWRGWLPLPDDGDDDDSDDDDLQPVPGGPYTRAHLFNLLR